MSYQRMNDKRNLKETEGVRIIYDSCSERCCFSKYRISDDQLEALNILRSRSRIPFNKENLVHSELLKQYWKINFPELEFPADGKSEKWKEIGFQGKDPSTDFRGAGFFGLEQLVFLSSTYPQEYKAMLEAANNYSFAISVLNITHLLMCYFQLHKLTAVGITGGKTLGIRYLQCFCRLNAVSLDTINELYVAAVIKMHDTWKDMNKVKKLNVMQFSAAILAAGDFVVSLLESQPEDILQLKKLAFA
ncbi:hypothetical protein SteCoe_20105 [Stentor coeruleus]|uniref:ELMO domain-containing protein n=1 Tax=Stentor coeruleus TaxID=5963 RepID=A0A1R2BSX3_9CILI|nr:hypothetical protein SteCoe_20105 [Stentor coeruleus]